VKLCSCLRKVRCAGIVVDQRRNAGRLEDRTRLLSSSSRYLITTWSLRAVLTSRTARAAAASFGAWHGPAGLGPSLSMIEITGRYACAHDDCGPTQILFRHLLGVLHHRDARVRAAELLREDLAGSDGLHGIVGHSLEHSR
jgi:hypothetical protein